MIHIQMNGIYLHSHLVLKTALGKRKDEIGVTTKTTNSTNTTSNHNGD